MQLEKNIIKIDELNAEAWAINRKEPVKAIEISQLTLASAKQLNYKMGEAQALKTLGAASTWVSKNDDSFTYNHKALELFTELNDKKNIASVYYNLGANYSYVSDFDLSIKHYSLCYMTSKEIGDEYGMADGLNGMGTIYYRTNQNDNALEVLHESEEICERLNAKDIYIKVLDGLGEAYYNKGLNETALPYYIKSADLSNQMGNRQVEAFAVDGLGRTYAALDKPAEALTNFNKSLQLRRDLNFKPGVVISLFNIGDFYFNQKKYTEAIANYQESYELAKEINNKEGIYKACQKLAETYELLKQFEKAVFYFKIYSTNKDEVVHEKSAQLVKSAEAQNKLLQAQAEKVLFEEKAKELENFSSNLVEISEIGQKILSSLSVEIIVNTVQHSVKKLMDADGFGIALSIEKENKLNFPLYIENGESFKDISYDIKDESRLGVVCFNKQKEIIIGDYEVEIRTIFNTNTLPKFGKNPASLIYIPLVYSSKTLGVITVQSFNKNAYTNYHVNILKNIATYTAIALQNASLYKNQEEIVAERTKELLKSKEEIENTYQINKKVSEIGRQITSNLNLGQIFKKLHASISEVMNADCFGVRIYLPEENVIQYKYEIENEKVYSDEVKVSLNDDDNYTVWCLKNNKDIFIGDNLNEYKKYVNQIKVVSGNMPTSLMFTPMILGEKKLGVITVQSFQKNAYKPFQLDILKTLATYAATALENAYLYQHLEEKVSERTNEVVKQKEAIEKTYDNTRIVSEIGKDISSIFSINDIIKKVYNSVNQLMDATMFGIGVYNEETKTINFSGVIEKGETLKDYDYSIIKDSDRPAVWCFNTQSDYVIKNFSEEFIKTGKVKNLKIVAGDATESIIYVPLTINKKQIGVITVQSYLANAYTDYHLQLLKSLAVYTAIAIDNASLYTNLESRVKERTQEIAKNYDDTRLLGEIAKELSSSLSIDTIITSVYTRINQLMKADAFGIGVLNPSNQLLEFNGFRENNEVIPNFTVDTKDINRLGALCFTTKKNIIIQDFENEYSKYIKLERKPILGNDTSSIIYLPLYSKQEIIGVITVQSLEKFAYTNYHVDLLQNLSTSIGIALDNANLYQNLEEKVKERTLEVVKQKEEIEKSNENTRLLSEIGKEITSTFSISEIISKVYNSINKIMDATMFGIGIYDDTTKQINFTGAIEKGEILDDYCYRIEDAGRPAIKAFLSQKEVVILDFTEEYLKTQQVKARHSLPGQNTESIIYAPLTINNKRIGVITIQSFNRFAYTDYHLQILKSLAVYAAIALDNASLYNNLDNRVKERTEEIRIAYENTKLLSQISEDISASLSVETINAKVYANINKLMDATMFGIGIYNPNNGNLEFKGFMENNQLMDEFSYSASDPNRLAAFCFTNKKEILINDYSKEYVNYIQGIQAPVSGKDSASIIYLPLFSKGEKIGVITVQSFSVDAYNDYHFNILKNLAVSVGIALDNANLYQNLESKVQERTLEVVKQKEEVEKSYQNTKLLSQIGNDITSTLSIEDIIEKVYANVNSLMDATGFGIGVYQPEKNIISFPLYIEDNERLTEINYDPNDKNRLTSICYSNNIEILINNLDEEILKYVQSYKAPLQGKRVYSLIYLPLIVKDKVIGVITTQSFKTNSYTDYHLQILKNLAVYIAIALDNAALYSSLDNRVKERTEEIRVAYENTRLLSQIAEDISSSLSVESINAKVYTNINKLMDATMFGIGIANSVTSLLEFKGFIENNIVLDSVTFDLNDENRLATQCFTKQKEIFILNYQVEYKKHIKDLKKTAAGSQAGSIIYLPIFSKENCIGVFTVQSPKTNAYTEYQLNLLRNLAVSIGIALDNANLYQNLEFKVKERTSEVNKQKAIIEEKNKDITDSIKYAKKIQQAVVPNINDFNKNFTDSFILYKPKDIVSGDFYWFKHFEDVTVFAAADCTGHGVPGAFMSIICNDIIDRVINNEKVNNPSMALQLIDEALVQLIRKTSETSANDGMDIAMCAYYRKENRIEFAGANRPMLLCRNNEMIEYKASKFSIGGQSTDGKHFELNSIDLQKGDVIYLFTDGYADQFGGDRGKKFKFKNLKEFLLKNHSKPCISQKKLLDLEFETWKGELEQVDDVCVIGVKI